MERPSFLPVVLILINVCIAAVGQIVLRYGAAKLGDLNPGKDIFASFLGAIKGMITPYVFLGLALYAISAVIWIVVINQVNLSFAYPMISLSYVLVVLLSAVVLHERVSLVTVVGLLFISGGVSLIGIGYSTGK